MGSAEDGEEPMAPFSPPLPLPRAQGRPKRFQLALAGLAIPERSRGRRVRAAAGGSVWGRGITPSSAQIPRLKYGCLRPGLGHTGERHCLLDGEGHGLPPPIRRQSLTNRRVAFRGPAPRAKPVGAPPLGLPRPAWAGFGGHPNPFEGEDRLSRELPSICLSEPLPCPIAGFGFRGLGSPSRSTPPRRRARPDRRNPRSACRGSRPGRG